MTYLLDTQSHNVHIETFITQHKTGPYQVSIERKWNIFKYSRLRNDTAKAAPSLITNPYHLFWVLNFYRFAGAKTFTRGDWLARHLKTTYRFTLFHSKGSLNRINYRARSQAWEISRSSNPNFKSLRMIPPKSMALSLIHCYCQSSTILITHPQSSSHNIHFPYHSHPLFLYQ